MSASPRSKSAVWWFRGLHANLIARLAAPPRAGERRGSARCRLRHRRLPGAARAPALPGAAASASSSIAGACGDGASAKAAPRSWSARCVAPALRRRNPSTRSSAPTCCAIAASSRPRRSRRSAAASSRAASLVLNLPAYRWLFSAHDLAVDNVRRFGAAEVRALLRAAGFVDISIAYWNSLLFPLMVARRLSSSPARSERCRAAAAARRAALRALSRARGLRSPRAACACPSAARSWRPR